MARTSRFRINRVWDVPNILFLLAAAAFWMKRHLANAGTIRYT
ncbi:MAG TPA: hypothetical protein VKB35_07305 [Ktedonobacteraceae bacterium]|nr:hypothetical protein [Ktedonobacteraceae bacterium]